MSLKKIHYLSNVNPPTFPNGFDIEIFTFQILKYFYNQKLTKNEGTCNHKDEKLKFQKVNIKNKTNLRKFRVTLDNKRDLIFLKNYSNY